MVALIGTQQDSSVFCLGFQTLVDVAEGGVTINLGFAAAQQIEVRALNN